MAPAGRGAAAGVGLLGGRRHRADLRFRHQAGAAAVLRPRGAQRGDPQPDVALAAVGGVRHRPSTSGSRSPTSPNTRSGRSSSAPSRWSSSPSSSRCRWRSAPPSTSPSTRPPRVREVVKPVVELLAGIPSVVLGFFALLVMASWFQDWFGLESRLNAIVAGVALSFAIIPIIFTISEEALGAVPRSYIEASTALGAARWQTIVRVLHPGRQPRAGRGRGPGAGPGGGRDHDRADGLGQRRHPLGALRRLGPHPGRHHRRRAGRGGGRRRPLHGAVLSWAPCCSSPPSSSTCWASRPSTA